MTQLRISELAERSGVPPSTLRYYERIGLVQPKGRSANGYRVYDETTVERLAFIARAKRLGMSLDDVATLVDVWFEGECRPLQDRLRVFVTGRIGDLRRQMADEAAFERQLQRILAGLERSEPSPDRCGPDCGCDTDPLEPPITVACSLGDSDRSRRVAEWQQVLSAVDRVERNGDQLRLVFPAGVAITTELARLCAAEAECCSFFEFGIAVTADAVSLTVDGPDRAADVFAELLPRAAATGGRE